MIDSHGVGEYNIGDIISINVMDRWRARGEKDLREEEIWHLENVVSKDLRGCDVVSGDSSYISRYKSRLRRVEEN